MNKKFKSIICFQVMDFNFCFLLILFMLLDKDCTIWYNLQDVSNETQ